MKNLGVLPAKTGGMVCAMKLAAKKGGAPKTTPDHPSMSHVRALLDDRGLSESEASEMAGAGRNWLGGRMSSGWTIQIKYLLGLARALGVTAEYLIDPRRPPISGEGITDSDVRRATHRVLSRLQKDGVIDIDERVTSLEAIVGECVTLTRDLAALREEDRIEKHNRHPDNGANINTKTK